MAKKVTNTTEDNLTKSYYLTTKLLKALLKYKYLNIYSAEETDFVNNPKVKVKYIKQFTAEDTHTTDTHTTDTCYSAEETDFEVPLNIYRQISLFITSKDLSKETIELIYSGCNAILDVINSDLSKEFKTQLEYESAELIKYCGLFL